MEVQRTAEEYLAMNPSRGVYHGAAVRFLP